MKQWITGTLNSSNDIVVGPMLNELMEILKSTLSQTSGFVTQIVFYALYCIMWLMDPVHVNTHHLREKYASKIFGPLWVFPYLGRRNDALIEAEDKREFEREVFRHKEADQRKDTQEKIYGILRTYFFLKNVMNGLFAVLNWALFTWLRLDLAKIMAALCFLLSFIPELGAMVAFVVPLPICLMMPENCTVYGGEDDCQYDKYCSWNTTQAACQELENNGRMSKAMNFSCLLTGMIIIKFAVGNILESMVMGRDRTLMGAVSKQDELKETHPVVIIFAVVFFGEIWGPLGMLICVPIISILRLTFNFWKYKFDPTS